MARKRIYIAPLKKWFPANDSYATTIARLCILREDFFLEIKGIVENPIQPLDENTAAWRHNYFFRNSVRTLMEIRSCLQALRGEARFVASLSRLPQPHKAIYEEFEKQIFSEHDLIKEIRNKIGGHVNQTAVQEAVDNLDFERSGLYERGEDVLQTHYKFANDLYLAVLKPGDAAKGLTDEKIQEILDLTQRMANLMPALNIIGLIFNTYLRERGFID